MLPYLANEPETSSHVPLSEEFSSMSTTTSRIVIVGADPHARVSLCRGLRRLGFEARVVEEIGSIITQATRQPPDIILVAHLAGQPWDAAGADALCRHPDSRDIPVVMVCEQGDDVAIAQALSSGFRDVWVGPLSPAVLKARVGALLRTQEEIARLREQVCVDELTAVFNRRGILAMLERETNRMNRNGTRLGILLIDVDDFKQVNDTYGHNTGDDVLSAIGRVLQQNIRSSDAAGRIGGDEFLVVLPDVDEYQAHQVAARIRSGIEQISIPGVQLQVSASVGVAVSEGQAQRAGRGLIDDADRSMYRCKRGGVQAKA